MPNGGLSTLANGVAVRPHVNASRKRAQQVAYESSERFGSQMTIFGLAARHWSSYPDLMVRRALLAFLILLAAPKIADACVCGQMAPCQRFWTFDAVFTGLVTSVSLSDDKTLSYTTIVVERGFRGASGQIVLTGETQSDCHYRFIAGQRYLVYASRLADGSLTSSRCSGNKAVAAAQEDLDYAEHLPAPGSGGRIFGRVRGTEQDLLDRRNSKDIFPASGDHPARLERRCSRAAD